MQKKMNTREQFSLRLSKFLKLGKSIVCVYGERIYHPLILFPAFPVVWQCSCARIIHITVFPAFVRHPVITNYF